MHRTPFFPAALAALILSAAPVRAADSWADLDEAIVPPGASGTSPAHVVLFDDALPSTSWQYIYGGRTAGKALGTKGRDRVFAYYGDDAEWSGWTVGFPVPYDLSKIRADGAVEFWVRGAQGGEKFWFGMLDDASDAPNRKVQSKVASSGYVQVTTAWKKVVIPLRDFGDQGMWWDPKAQVENVGAIDWSRIDEFRISTDQNGNTAKTVNGGPVRIYFDAIRIVPQGPPPFDRAAFWKNFGSTAPDETIADFERPADRQQWVLNKGPSTALDTAFPAEAGHGHVLELKYLIGVWGGAGIGFPRPGAPSDWSRHRGLRLAIYYPRAYGVLRLAILDSTRESWIWNARVKKGWNSIRAPFAEFELNGAWQPDDVEPNRRLDLGQVRFFEFQPGESGVRVAILVDDIALTNSLETGPAESERDAIRWNQLGYLSGGPKRFLVANTQEKSFALLDSTGKAAHTGSLAAQGAWAPSGEEVAVGDFSRFGKPGLYRLAVGKKKSEPFRIGDDVYRDALGTTTRSYYFQRAAALDSKYAGIWARGFHADTALPLLEAGRAGKWSAPGGWYDAGDYGKYVVNAGITLGTLLHLQELHPALVADGANDIPESGNGRGDLLDEIRWETDWLLRMQDRDGGVFFKIGPREWDGMVLPTETTAPRHLIGKSTTAALDFAAALAQAARVFRPVDAKHADQCLAAAEKAWKWAVAHPAAREPKDCGGTGAYGDTDPADEFAWAAAELWLTTGKPAYKAEATRRLRTLPVIASSNWSKLQNLAWFSLSQRDDSLGLAARAAIVERADSTLAALEGSAYRIPLDNFFWGSNAYLLNHATVLAWAHRATGSWKYRDGMLEILDYVFGRNATGTSMVTAVGTHAARDPHHRPMVGDTTDLPIPGFLVGGPNSGMEDAITRDPGGVRYPHTEPARAWLDHNASYASNETCINWNAPLVFLLGYVEGLRNPASGAASSVLKVAKPVAGDTAAK